MRELQGVLSQWVKHEGDQVRKGGVLAVIETDKAAMDMEAYDEGVLTRILVAEGASVPIGTPIAVIGEAAAAAGPPSPVPAAVQAERAMVPAPVSAPPAGPSPAGRPSASPLARRLARESRDLITRARARKLTPDELSGGTFTVSNLGMYGIRQFTAVINPPQAAILAVGEAVREPVVRDDQVSIAITMTLTLSIDHRVVDGATAARFLTRLRELTEQPVDIVI